ncbi:hypothetical protein EI94DRAFT_1829063 [Lactarius quietus]|nr:hypothetical protein EI94DRAFT_1829063 [Lactarius quietus]
MFALPLLSLLLASSGFAAPSPRSERTIPASALYLPDDQTQLVAPTTAADFVALGLGTQNYTCTDAGNYTSIGAEAQMLDISTLFGTPEFDRIQDDAYDFWSNYEGTRPYDYDLAIQLYLKFSIDVIGQHYFVNSNGALSAKFDFTSSGPTAGNPEAFVIANKIGDIKAPTGIQDVDWLELEGVSGDLAKEVFRVYTQAGQPPSSCTPGSPDIEVKYCAQYWFFGSTLN